MPPDSSSLVHYEQASLYDATFRTRREDVDFFVRLAKEHGGPILELGAGTGRVTFALVGQGHQVTAVDKSRAMLSRLKAQAETLGAEKKALLTVRHGDMTRLDLGRKFRLVLATFNVVGHLKSYREMGRFLRVARAHLAPGGMLAFDVPIPHPDEVEADPEELFFAPRFKHPELGHWMRQSERFEYDPASQQLLVESTFSAEGSEGSVSIPLVLRQWFPKELEAILAYEGFSAVESRADYTDHPGLVAEDSLVMLARR